MIWHYLKGKAASQGACLVPAPAAVVQKASISTDLSMEYFSLGEKGSITDSVPFSLRLGWNCAMEDSPSPDPLGVSRSSTVIQTRTKKPISWLFAMQGAARQCVCAQACSPLQACQLPWGNAASYTCSHTDTYSHTGSCTLCTTQGKKIQQTGSYNTLKDILRFHMDPENQRKLQEKKRQGGSIWKVAVFKYSLHKLFFSLKLLNFLLKS